MDEKGLRQRQEALVKANDIRIYRSKMKQQIKGRQMTLDEVHQLIFDPPPQIQTMLVGNFLRALPTFGLTKRDKALKMIQASGTTTLAGLTDRQRRLLASLVSTYQRYLLPSEQLDQEVNDGDYTPGGNHNRPEWSTA